MFDGLQGLDVDSGAYGLLEVRDSGGIHLEHLRFVDNDGAGLAVYNSYMRVVDCIFENNSRGAHLTDNSYMRATGTLFNDNGGHGVRVQKGAILSSIGCEFSANSGRGALVEHGARFFCHDCRFISNGGYAVNTGWWARANLSESILEGDDGVVSHTGSSVGVWASTIETTGIALEVISRAELLLGDVQFAGSIRAKHQVHLLFGDVVQTVNPSVNKIWNNSTLEFNSGQLVGDTYIDNFSNGRFEHDAVLEGNLFCGPGSNLICMDPAAQVIGSSDCGFCFKP
jgi:hypothetical protein